MLGCSVGACSVCWATVCGGSVCWVAVYIELQCVAAECAEPQCMLGRVWGAAGLRAGSTGALVLPSSLPCVYAEHSIWRATARPQGPVHTARLQAPSPRQAVAGISTGTPERPPNAAVAAARPSALPPSAGRQFRKGEATTAYAAVWIGGNAQGRLSSAPL